MGDDTTSTGPERRQKAGEAALEEAEHLARLADAQESELEARKLAAEAIEKQIKANKLLGLSYDDEADQLAALNVQMDEYLKKSKDFTEEGKNMAGVWASNIGLGKKFTDTIVGQTLAVITGTGGLKGFASGLLEMASMANLGTNAITKVSDASLKLLWDTDTAMVGFNKATGQLDRYGEEIRTLNKDMYDHGVSISDAGAAYESMVKNVTDLNVMTKIERKSISDTTALLGEMGVSVDTTGANIQFMTKSLGMGAASSAKFQRELFTLSKEIGMPASEMADQFKAAGPKMAEFGKQAGKVFKDLAVNARKAGMEVSELLDITGKFDTFEGAADSVGQLNAILGGPYLNSMEMVMETDPTKRMQMLSGALNKAGKSFESMTYYEKKSVAAAAGFKDVEQLAKTMANNFDGVAGSTHKTKAELEALEKQQQDFNTVSEEMSQFMRAFAVDLYSVIKPLKELIQKMQNGIQSFNEWGESVGMGKDGFGKLVFALGTGLLAFAAIKKMVVGMIAVKKAWSAVTAGQSFIMKLFTKATDEQAESQRNLGESGKMSGKSMMSFGFAMLLIGAGIGLAAVGVAQLAGAFAQLNGPQIIGATIAIGLFGAMIVGVIAVLGAMNAGPQAALTWAAIGVIVAIGAAALMAGAGVMLLGKGIGFIATAFVALSAAFVDGGAPLLAMPLWLNAMAAGLLMFAVAGILAIPAMLGLGGGISSMVQELDAQAKLNESMADLNRSIAEMAQHPADNLIAIGNAMEKIVTEINRVMPEKATALAKALNASAAINRAAVATSAGAAEQTFAQNAAGASGERPHILHIALNIKGREIDKQVVEIVGGHMKKLQNGG